VDKSTASIGTRETTVQVLGVLATASLVNSNKFVLSQLNFPAKSAGLTFLHNTCTFCWMRLSSSFTGGKPHNVHWGWLLCITALGSLSVAASNLLLQLTSVKFHQLSKLASLPAGAVVDFYLYDKRRSWKDFAGLACVTYGIYVTSRDEMSFSIQPACVALVFIVGYLATAVFVRRLCIQHEITSTQFLYLCVPWGMFSSLVLFLMALSFEPHNSVAEISFEFNFMEASASVSANLLLAVSVQWLSMWAASKSTTMIYAIMGQAKTAATIILGVLLFQDSISPRGACGLLMCLTASLTLAASEAYAKEGQMQRENRVSAVGTWLVIILFVATLFIDEHIMSRSKNMAGDTVASMPFLTTGQFVRRDSFQSADATPSVVDVQLPICVAILAYDGNTTLVNTLDSFKDAGLFQEVQVVMIHFQKIDSRSRENWRDDIVRRYPLLKASFTEQNIEFRAFLLMAQNCKEPYFMTIEEDFRIVPQNYHLVQSQLSSAVDMIENGAFAVLLRSREYPGHPDYAREAFEKGILGAQHLLDHTTWNYRAEEDFDGITLCRATPKYWCASTQHASFTNNPALYSTISYVRLLEKSPSLSYVDIEPTVTKMWSSLENLTVSRSMGLFTHDRVDRSVDR